MTRIVLVPDHFYKCPICGEQCQVEEESGYNRILRKQGSFQHFICFHPLVTDPLHYYSHMVDSSVPNEIQYQEFSLDLGHKSVMFANCYAYRQTSITNSYDSKPLELSFIITPDFPDLASLKKKVLTAITFS